MKILLTLLLFWSGAAAAVLISPVEAMQHTFGPDAEVTKQNTLLTGAQAETVSRRAGLKLQTKIYRIYTASLGGKAAGYGVLITRKVRQKDAAVLYMISARGDIASIEIVAFNEPPEYMPQHGYLKQFEGKNADDTLRVGKDIPAISGATLSARNVTDGARLALAVFDVVIGKRP